MTERRFGRIVNVASTAAQVRPTCRAYCAAKHGVLDLAARAGAGDGAQGRDRQRGLPGLYRDRHRRRRDRHHRRQGSAHAGRSARRVGLGQSTRAADRSGGRSPRRWRGWRAGQRLDHRTGDRGRRRGGDVMPMLHEMPPTVRRAATERGGSGGRRRSGRGVRPRPGIAHARRRSPGAAALAASAGLHARSRTRSVNVCATTSARRCRVSTCLARLERRSRWPDDARVVAAPDGHRRQRHQHHDRSRPRATSCASRIRRTGAASPVRLTPAGRRQFKRMAATHEGWIVELLAGWPPEQKTVCTSCSRVEGPPRAARRRPQMNLTGQ